MKITFTLLLLTSTVTSFAEEFTLTRGDGKVFACSDSGKTSAITVTSVSCRCTNPSNNNSCGGDTVYSMIRTVTLSDGSVKAQTIASYNEGCLGQYSCKEAIPSHPECSH